MRRKSGRKRGKQYKGRVVKRPFSPGSKSDYPAVQIITEENDEQLVLRRRGANPFYDEVLEALVGKKIKCKGRRKGPTLILSDWEEVPSEIEKHEDAENDQKK